MFICLILLLFSSSARFLFQKESPATSFSLALSRFSAQTGGGLSQSIVQAPLKWPVAAWAHRADRVVGRALKRLFTASFWS